jgi:hypothetical protein
MAGGHHTQHLYTLAELIASLIASQRVPPLSHFGINLALKFIALRFIRKYLMA